MEKIFESFNKIFSFIVSKKTFSNLLAFCVKNQSRIFIILCFIYASFLCCITKLVIVIIILFWSSFFFTVVYMLNKVQIPVFKTVLGTVFFFRIFYIIKTENIKLPLCIGLLLSLIFVFLYFYFENSLLLLALKEKYKKLKQARLVFTGCITPELKYFGAVSTLASSIFSVLVLLKFIYKDYFFVLYSSLNPDEQGLALVILISLFFFVVVGGLLDFVLFESPNNSTLDFFSYLQKFICLLRVVSGMVFFFFFFEYFSALPQTPSMFVISKFRIYCGVGYTWTSVVEFTLAEEYTKITRGHIPPLLNTMAVDALKTSNRIELLNLLLSEQSRSLISVMLNTTDIEEIIKFNHQQTVIFNSFLEKLENGNFDL